MRRLIFLGLLPVALAAAQASGPLRARPRSGRVDVAPPPAAVERPAPIPEYVPKHDDPVIERAMAYAQSFGASLPDFLCKQVTTRRVSRNMGRKWKTVDTVEAEVLYVDGREDYRDVRVDGRPLRSFDSLDGTTSTGEYGTILRNLFHPDTATGFKRGEDDEIDGRRALTYEVRVGSESSHWRISVNRRAIASAYYGRVWIEEETGRVFRVEMQAVLLPPDFPLASSEITIDYGPIEIGYETPWLPVRSANLACFRQEKLCRKNELVFSDYRKFGSEASIDFGENEGESEKEDEPRDEQ